jgi:DNA polymerase-3 subunit alpha
MGIQVLPPDVNRSEIDFTAENGAIRFGLAAIKNVGRAAVELILAAREEGGPFVSLLDFCCRCQARGSVNRATIEALIQCGAFDAIESNRHALIQLLDPVLQTATSTSRDLRAGQTTLELGGGGEEDAPIAQFPVPDVPDYPQDRRLAFEKELLGFYISGHPLDRFQVRLSREARDRVGDLAQLQNGTEVCVGGIITQLAERHSKQSNEKYARFMLEDVAGHTVEVVVFPKVYRKCGQGIAKEAVVVVRGRTKIEDSARDDEEAPPTVELMADDVKPIGSGLSANGNGATRLGALCIRLEEGRTNPGMLTSLRAVLEQKPGDAPVRFLIREGKAEYRKRAAFAVALSDELRREIEHITGQRVWIEA